MLSDWGVRARIILIAIIPTGLVALIMGFYFVSERMKDLNINVKDRALTISNYLSQTSEYSILSRNSQALTRLVTSARDGDDDLLAVAIFSSNNLLLSSSGTKELVSLLSKKSNPLLLQTEIKAVPQGFIVRAPISSQPTVSKHALKQSKDQIPVIGYVAVLMTDRNIQLRQYQTIATALIILLMGLILGGVLAKKMARNITIPIIQLANAVKRIKKGQLNVAIKASTSGELMTLVEGFNDMSESLYKAREEMQVAIEQATADINATNTALEEQNVELTMARKEAIEASRVKSEFLANMSHEIRTPMNGVIGFTNLLLRTGLTEKQQDYLNTIKKSSNGLLSIIDNILDFSKIEAGKMQLENRSLSISDCVDETLNLLAPAAQAKNIEILGIVYRDVPEHLLGDAGRIGQILTNLCNNAIKFTQRGTIQIRVMLEKENNQSVRLRVNITDTGVGLSEQQQKVLFHAFTQADTTTTRRFGGTGLGLVISKKLVESMKGKIGIESKENVGSTFWFSIELERDLQKESQSLLGFPGRKILFHDANNISQLATQCLLEQWDAIVESTNDISGLITKAETYVHQQKNVHLVLLGDYTPKTHKKELLELLKLSKQLACPMAVLSNSKEENDIHSYSALGINKYLSKPVTKNLFYNLLLDWFRIREQHPQIIDKNYSTKKISILCVDDNQANLKLIVAFLSDFSIKPQAARNAKEAIELCRASSFDLIFMDIQMPDMDGLEATKIIRKINRHYKDSPIVAITAHAMKGEKHRLLQEGMDDYLTKPISQEQLRKSIQKWTSRPITLAVQESSSKQEMLTDKKELSVDWPLSLKNAGERSELAREMLQMLVDSFSEARNLIQQHLEDLDTKNLIAQVHKLHGATAYCGVPKLKSLAFQYESHLKNHGINGKTLTINKKFINQLDKVESDAKLILG